MAKREKFKVIITDPSYYEDLIWMSYRYCIGRKTIAAHAHAGDIAVNSYDCLSDERKEFMANDIRKEINDVLHVKRNCSCSDYRRDIDEDGLSLICRQLITIYGNVMPEGFDFETMNYEVYNGSVTIRESNDNHDEWNKIAYLYGDLLPWIKLANAFDKKCHKKIIVEYDGKTEEYECFPYPFMLWGGREIYMKWCDVNTYLSNPVLDSSINEKYIKEITDLA